MSCRVCAQAPGQWHCWWQAPCIRPVALVFTCLRTAYTGYMTISTNTSELQQQGSGVVSDVITAMQSTGATLKRAWC